MSTFDVRSSLLFGDSPNSNVEKDSDLCNSVHSNKSPNYDQDDILTKWRLRQKRKTASEITKPDESTPIPAGRHDSTPVESNFSSNSATPYHTPLPNQLNYAQKLLNAHFGQKTSQNYAMIPNTSIIDQQVTPKIQTNSKNLTNLENTPNVKIIVHQATQTERNQIRNVGLQVNYKKPVPVKVNKSTEATPPKISTSTTATQYEIEDDDKSDITEVSQVTETRHFGCQTDDFSEERVIIPDRMKDDPILKYFSKLELKVMNSLAEVDEFLKETDFLDEDSDYSVDFDTKTDLLLGDHDETAHFEERFNKLYNN